MVRDNRIAAELPKQPVTIPSDGLLTMRQAIEFLGVSERTIRSLVKDEELLVVRITKREYRFDLGDLRALIERRKQKGTAPMSPAQKASVDRLNDEKRSDSADESAT